MCTESRNFQVSLSSREVYICTYGRQRERERERECLPLTELTRSSLSCSSHCLWRGNWSLVGRSALAQRLSAWYHRGTTYRWRITTTWNNIHHRSNTSHSNMHNISSSVYIHFISRGHIIHRIARNFQPGENFHQFRHLLSLVKIFITRNFSPYANYVYYIKAMPWWPLPHAVLIKKIISPNISVMHRYIYILYNLAWRNFCPPTDHTTC